MRCPGISAESFDGPPRSIDPCQGWRGSVGRPLASQPIGRAWRCPNCSAVTSSWHDLHRHRMLLSSSLPPNASGLIWSGTVEALTIPRSEQRRHSGSARSRRARCAWPARPRRRSAIATTPEQSIKRRADAPRFVCPSFPCLDVAANVNRDHRLRASSHVGCGRATMEAPGRDSEACTCAVVLSAWRIATPSSSGARLREYWMLMGLGNQPGV